MTMYFKAIPVAERLPEPGKFVTTIDSAGEHRVYSIVDLPEHGKVWKMRDANADESPNDNLPITSWLEEIDFGSMARKAEKWDDLDSKISRFYPEPEYDEDGEEIEAEPVGDLCDIGEIAASALGYL